ncbi:hypothetical protein RND71_003772 [Anisodus tanguticus]|uniref:Leucine-rich repeat-containing N-terminal plant-type domain-containing protein n=1 Tax=Anisodus tanguticus TaxID=243964 RepID=A0AAE1SXA8_9SOLA|nr:hypothetical protein RND71_003772 [Anisodus tanguticus]
MLVVLLNSSNYISGVYCQCLEDQKDLLLKFKNNLTFDSSLSTKLVRWDQKTNCCLWPGISCDQEGHVLILELDNEAITSGVDNSSSPFDLQHLEKLNLVYNDLNIVQLPTEIYKLANLTYLNLLNAGFAGLRVQNLKALVKNLANLKELCLDAVNISLKGSEWCSALSSSLPQLTVLSISS